MTKKPNKAIEDRTYRPEDYKGDTEFASGLAMTHEQVNDTLAEGTIDAKIEKINGNSQEIPRKGYEK